MTAPAEAGTDRTLATRVLDRTAGARAIAGNAVRLLVDGPEAYPAMLEVIHGATERIHFGNYIIRGDATGERFADALIAAARRGVAVRVQYDWLGSKGTRRSYWRALRAAGIEVRAFNSPRLGDLFGNLARNHGKLVSADARVAILGGFCIGDEWTGDPESGTPPWRDTAVEVRGPAVGAIDESFARTWRRAGGHIPQAEADGVEIPAAGSAEVRVIGSVPGRARIARLLELMAAGAQDRLWLTDAYTVVLPQMRSAVQDAARGGVDVRLLVPGSSDLPMVRNLSRFGYRDLLQAGVRIFEWNGPMLHAKSFVSDGRWVRVGSSNLNPSSFLGNWELDVLVEDEALAARVEDQFRRDLARSAEVELRPRSLGRLERLGPILPTRYGHQRPEAGDEAIVTRAFRERGLRARRTLRTLVTGARRSIYGPLALLLTGIGALFYFLPKVTATVAAVICLWLAVSAGREALRRRGT